MSKAPLYSRSRRHPASAEAALSAPAGTDASADASAVASPPLAPRISRLRTWARRQRSLLAALAGALSAVAVGTIVATAGPLLRDIFGGDAPQLLRPGVFLGVIALVGSILFVVLDAITGSPLLSQVLVIALVFISRIVAVRWDIETAPADDLSDRVWSFWNRRHDG